MQELKRLEVKYVRDRAKSSYPPKEGALCQICNTTQEIQFHHYVGLTNLWLQFKRKQRIVIHNTDDIEVYRDQFISTHTSELYDNGEFLCKKHHMALHKIYGKSPSLGTAGKQKRWVEKQRVKHNGLDK